MYGFPGQRQTECMTSMKMDLKRNCPTNMKTREANKRFIIKLSKTDENIANDSDQVFVIHFVSIEWSIVILKEQTIALWRYDEFSALSSQLESLVDDLKKLHAKLDLKLLCSGRSKRHIEQFQPVLPAISMKKFSFQIFWKNWKHFQDSSSDIQRWKPQPSTFSSPWVIQKIPNLFPFWNHYQRTLFCNGFGFFMLINCRCYLLSHASLYLTTDMSILTETSFSVPPFITIKE